MRIEYDMATDERLIHLVREAEAKRSWFWRFTDTPLFGMLLAIGISSLMWTGFIYAALYAYHMVSR